MSRQSFSSLRFRLLLLVLLAVIPALGLMLYTASTDRASIAADAQADALRVARRAASDQARLIEQARQLLVDLSQLPGIRREGSLTCSAIFSDLRARYLQTYPRYTNLGVIDPQGNIFCSVLPVSGRVNVADRAYFQQARETLEFTVGDATLDRALGKASVQLAYPVLDFGGELRLMIFATLDLEWLNQLARESDLPEGSTLAVTDQQGNILAHYPDPERWMGQPLPESSLLQAIRESREEGTTEIADADGIQRLYAFTVLSRSLTPGGMAEMYVSVGIPSHLVFAKADQVLARNLLALGLVVAMALLATWLGGDIFVVRQVRGLLNATRRLAAGDLKARTGLPRKDQAGELGQLAQAFDRMAEALEQRERERRQADAALRDSEELYRTLARNFPNGAVILYDSDLRYTIADGAGLAAVGLSKEMLEGKTIWEVFPPDISAAQEPHYRAALAGAPSVFEQPFAGRIYQVNALPVKDERGVIFAGMIMTQDITERKQAYELLQQRVEERTRELRALLDTSRNVASTLELQPLLGLILDQLGGVIEYQGATIFRLEGDDLTILGYRGPISPDQARRIRFSLSQAGANREVIQRREPVIIGDVRGDERLADEFRAAAGEQLNTTYAYLSCWLGVPLVSKDRVIGMLSIDHGTPGFYTEHHASLAMAFASQAAVAIENARLFEIEKRRAEQFRVINEVSQRVTSILSVGDILKHTVNLIRETFGYYHVHIGLIEQDVVVYQATAGVWRSDPDCQCCTDMRLRVGQDGVTGLAAGSGEAVLVPDVSLEPLYIPVQTGQAGSELVLPMKVKGQVVGVLNVESEQPNAFDASDVAVLQSLANQVAVAIDNARLYESEHRRADQFRVLAEVGQRITSILDVDRLLSQTVDAISEAFGYYHVGIAMIEEDVAVYKVGAGALWQGQPAGFNPPRLKIGREGLTGWVAASGAPLLVPDVSREPRYVRMEGSQTQSELTLPIKTKDRTIGVLDIQSDRLNAFDQSDLAVLQSLASQLAVAIENAWLFETEQRRAEQLRIINEVGRRVTSILTVDDLLAQTVLLIRESFHYYYASIGLIEGDLVVVKYGDPLRLKVGEEGIMGWVAEAGEPLRVPDVSREPRYVSSPSANRTRSELALPIKSRDQTIGVLDIESDRPDAFDDSDVAVLQSLASQLGVAIENARLYEQAQQLAALEERQKLARELHDSVSQALYGIALGTRTARTLLSREPAAGAGVKALGEPLDYVLSLAEAGLAEMRALIFELRPESLEVEGLVAALTKQAASLRARHNLEVSADFGREPELSLPAKEALYRIAQEAFNNIAKHARATRVDVRLDTDGDGVALEIGDDGLGFDPRGEFPGHLGLRSMRERAEKAGGTFAVESAPGQGTHIRVRFPLAAQG